MKIHIADGPLKCKECGKQFTTSGEMFTEKGGMGVGACMRGVSVCICVTVCVSWCVFLHI